MLLKDPKLEWVFNMSPSSSPTLLPTLDLQLAVLRYLPTPVLVLSSLRRTVFANRAAERILGSPNPIQYVGSGILERGLDDLGVRLLNNGDWGVVLGKFDTTGKLASSSGDGREEEGLVHIVDTMVDNPRLKSGERSFRVLLSMLMVDNSAHYVLSFERSSHVEQLRLIQQDQAWATKRVLPRGHQISSPDGGGSVTPKGLRPDAVVDSPRDISLIKKAVFDSCTTAGFILSVDEKFYLTNKKTRELIGNVMGGAEGCDGLSLRTRLEIWDETFSRRLEPGDFPGMKLVRSRAPFTDFRCGFTHADTGDKIVMSVSGECLYDDDTGEFMGGICWCRDLQEYSDFLLDQQQRRLESHETICDLMPHMVWTTTPGGEVDYYSKRWYDFTGLTKEESLGKGFANVVHPEDLPKLLESWRFHTLHGTEYEVEARYRQKDGIYKWMLARACPLRDEAGNLLKWYGTTTDIHDLVMQRIEARRNKLQMLTVLAHAEVNLFSVDKNRIVTMAEGGMQWDSDADSYDINNKSTLIGQDAIEVSQRTQEGGIPGYEKNVLDILAGKVSVAQSEDRIGDKVYRTRVVAEMEHNTHDGGEKPVVKGVLGLSIDVTDMRARAALEMDNTRLMMEEQSARDSSQMKSQFLANMSHELRTPAAGVIGMVELLSEDTTLSPEQREYVCSIQLSAKALLTIVNDILDFSKIESGRLDIEEVPFSLSKVLDELCKLLNMFAHQKGLNFIYENTMDEELEVTGDPGRTRQVLSNLLTNALKFTEEGTVKLLVSATRINPCIGDETLEVQFVIEDTGIGIEKSVLDKLFRPFSQGDSSTARLYGGTGLGLTISRNLASLMHGSITLESTYHKGSTATFTIPLKVSSWARKSSLISASTLNPGSRYYSKTSRPSIWAAPLAPRAVNQDLLKQQISNSMTNYSQTTTEKMSLESHNNTDAISMTPLVSENLTLEQRNRIHILVVEDNAINQKIAIKNIRNLGFPVTAVWNGREALSYLLSPSTNQPRPSMILMDVQMPVMDGYEATRILRTDAQYSSFGSHVTDHDEASPGMDVNERTNIGQGGREGKNLGGRGRLRDIPVIAMTASAIQGDKEKCYAAGMDDYLAKPVEKRKLEEMLVKWAKRRRGWVDEG